MRRSDVCQLTNRRHVHGGAMHQRASGRRLPTRGPSAAVLHRAAAFTWSRGTMPSTGRVARAEDGDTARLEVPISHTHTDRRHVHPPSLSRLESSDARRLLLIVDCGNDAARSRLLVVPRNGESAYRVFGGVAVPDDRDFGAD
jgi:hypothetical protein